MKALLWKLHHLILLLIVLAAADVSAQWKAVAPALLGPIIKNGGACCYQNGILWIGNYDVWMSPDLGATWTKRTPPTLSTQGPDDRVNDINFFDQFHGMVATYDGYVYFTIDGGLNWTQAGIPHPLLNDDARFVFYMNSSQTMVASVGSYGLFVSRDGGATWIETAMGQGVAKAYGKWIGGGTAYILSEVPGGALQNQFAITSDYANTWRIAPATANIDCWTFCVDKCDTNQIYLMNDAGIFSNDGGADIFVSNDLSASWKRTLQRPIFYFSSSITNSEHAIFAQTEPDGIIRSTDKGSTWKSIGGPGMYWDTRLVIAVNDNIIFAVDSSDGTVWKTINSGGDSLAISVNQDGILAETSDTLFLGDSLPICDSSLSRTLYFKRAGCNPPDPTGAVTNDGHYSVSNVTHDSLIVTFTPSQTLASNPILIITKSRGMPDTVYLVGAITPPRPLALATSDEHTDTIGGLVQIPIIVNGLGSKRDIELVVHYDTSLVYDGSFSMTGIALDKANEQWKGRSKISITGATDGILLGTADVNVFIDSGSNAHVWFDSLVVINALTPCEYAPATMAASTITEPAGCGVALIASFVRNEKIPIVSIRPNPASNRITIESTAKLSNASFEITDVLGARRDIWHGDIHSSNASEHDIEMLPAGIYFVRVTAGSVMMSAQFIIER
ncbi:MAG TPA: T9SS type A sorting domain-containing protein [Candidatus Kapabacteria bacterium]|nr:T9SS type A sorting domain-containing protein [Candidatus Kapabacteria bacterium]